MDTITVCRMACNDVVIKRKFGGVFASDRLPASRGPFSSFIINLDPQRLGGSHWVSVFFDERENKRYNERASRCYYFDSYGFPPLQRDILQFLKNNSSEIYYNETSYQQIATTTCGLYCLYFLYRYSRHLYDLPHLSGNNRKQNEIFIKHFIRRNMSLGNCCHSFHDKVQSCKLMKTI